MSEYLKGLDRLEKSKEEYKDLHLHIVIAHYREKVDMMAGLVSEILDNPAMAVMRHSIFVYSKAEDQASKQG